MDTRVDYGGQPLWWFTGRGVFLRDGLSTRKHRGIISYLLRIRQSEGVHTFMKVYELSN